MKSEASNLLLDEASLSAEELSMPALMRELELQKRPNAVLRMLMNALERKRQAKGLGWSRSWNKQGLNIFRTHKHELGQDADYFAPFTVLMESVLQRLPEPYRGFTKELLDDPERMAFTFYHNHEAGLQQFEGLTISIGRRIAGDRSKRDRLDLILEDARVAGRVDGRLDQCRLYVCPWSEFRCDKKHLVLESCSFNECEQEAMQELYENCVRFYHRWKSEEARQWLHWSSLYIDYFGPRSFIPAGTSFS